jgi:N-acetylmuramoyl-L-alanine amidase
LNVLIRSYLQRPVVIAALIAAALTPGALLRGAQAPASGAPYTLLSREGRRPLATRVVGSQEMFSLDDLAAIFGLTVKEDALAGGLTVSTRTQTIVLTPGQPLASVGGRLISLPAAPVRDGRTWLVPVDFVARALAPTLGTRLELRKPSRLVIVGEIRVPRVAGAIDPQGSLARLTLDVAPATPHAVTQDGSRLLVRFEADALDATLPASTAPDLIQAVRPGDDAALLVLELGPKFGSFRTADQPADRGAGRILIDVIAQTTSAAPTPAAPAPPAPEGPPLLDLAPAGALRAVVVDAGHGGEEEGAKGPGGVLEKTVTLAVARRLKAALEARLGVRVILTRDADQTVGLDERAAVANNNKADLFISLHANASVRPSAAGAEVFYLSLDEYGDQAERVARGESESVPVFGGGTRNVEVILWEMAQARYIEQSAVLAQAVETALRERVPMSPRAIQQAPFRVLVGANMPAVLVELGFITNPDQERQLASEPFQTSLVQALVDSVVRFRDARPPQRTTVTPAGGGRSGGPGAPR